MLVRMEGVGILPLQTTKLGQSNVFTPVCHSAHGGLAT